MVTGGVELAPGSLLRDRYRVGQRLGAGGFGATFAAVDERSGMEVAVKVLHLARVAEWKAVELFEREAKVLAALDHPGIPAYVDHFHLAEGAELYLVQALARGRSLAALVEDGWRITEVDAKALALEILDILIYLHGLQPPVIHRDIKPGNLVRDPAGKIQLVDFGSVRDTVRDTGSFQSSVVGTFGYMAPEQLSGHASPASDLYGLGVSLLHVLSHRDPSEIPMKKLKLDFRQVTSLGGEMATWIDGLIEPAPEDRYVSAEAARRALLGREASAMVPAPKRALAPATPPMGTRVTLTRSPRGIGLAIPPAGLRLATLSTGTFAAFWLAFVAFWTWGAAQASYLFAAFSIPFWLVGLGIAGKTVFDLFGRTHLSIERERFTFRRAVFGIGRNKEGPTRALGRAKAETLPTTNNARHVPTAAVSLPCGVETLRFGSTLSEVEREWIAEEINLFLGEP